MMERRGLPMLNHVLQHTLRSLCCDTQWVYAVFWRILPRNYPPPQWETEGGLMDRSKGNKRNWILVWEDGFCDFSACNSITEPKSGVRYGNHTLNHADESPETAMHPELFFKMSHEVYNYGEGLMGKVAADNSHKWVYREPMEHEISFLSPWHGSLDPHPRTWESQFKAGIQTISVISVREGLVQLGSTKKVVEDLNFVILMQRKFNYLQSIPGVFVPHPSPVASMKRRDGMDGPNPTDGPCWQGSKDPLLMNGQLARSESYPYRMTTNSKQFSSGILGVKRPPDYDGSHSLSSGRDFPFLSPGINFHDGSRFDCRQDNRQPECSSPPKALNTGQSANSLSLLPSMSSLHNLLSKLPSVTAPAPESNPTLPSSPSVLHLPTQQEPHPRQPISPSSSGNSPVGRSVLCPEDLNPSPESSPSRHPCGDGLAESAGTTSPQLDHDDNSSLREITTSESQLHHRPWQSTGSSDFIDTSGMRDRPTATRKDAGPGTKDAARKDVGPGTKDKLTSFLDSFDHDTLTELGLHEDLENSETYNSFLSEII